MTNHNKAKFRLGKTVMTHGAIDALTKSNQLPYFFLQKHQSGEWGEICEGDAELNNDAIAHEGEEDKQMRVMSVYKTSKNETIWIITEWNRSVTTILLPIEY
jgi:hypothetical protein